MGRARLVGRGGPNTEWIQMDTPTLTGKRIQQGFSGAGVIDEEDGAVIGCVVAADITAEDRIAWMIPTDIIAEYSAGTPSYVSGRPLREATTSARKKPVAGAGVVSARRAVARAQRVSVFEKTAFFTLVGLSATSTDGSI